MQPWLKQRKLRIYKGKKYCTAHWSLKLVKPSAITRDEKLPVFNDDYGADDHDSDEGDDNGDDDVLAHTQASVA